MKKLKLVFIYLSVLLASCSSPDKHSESACDVIGDPEWYQDQMDLLTDVMVHDIFSPPVAVRVYVYPCIASYEVLQLTDPSKKSMAKQLNGLETVPVPENDENICYNLSALVAFLQTGKSLIFSEDKIAERYDQLLLQMDSLGMPKKVIEASVAYGNEVSAHILKWASKDNYAETRSAPKYNIPPNDPGKWKPTPPGYLEGIEPHWNKIRPMVLESADQFKPAPPPPFSMEEGSEFYKLTMEVKEAVDSANEEKIAIASFWDCNPYVMNQTGHMMFASKKITPGGHWMGIAGLASHLAKHDMLHTSETAMVTAIGLFDAFISCWDEKYRSNLIRPETVINEYIDESWVPILQTPPFPEHTSGHSVASAAAGTILTAYIGDDFPFDDTVETKYGLPIRSFTSFKNAYEEAAISRLYGGIHYMPAITYGVKQGKEVGNFILENISTNK